MNIIEKIDAVIGQHPSSIYPLDQAEWAELRALALLGQKVKDAEVVA